MITIENVGKRFQLYDHPFDRAKDWIGLPAKKREFWALRNINFSVPPGSAVGIVGANGAGKSTLLKLLAGTLYPTEGTLQVDGRVSALLELGTGFHPEFTGRQNIWINGQLLGLSHEEIQGLEQEIIDFSELGDFIDQPLRTYSSGMKVRLGFSVAAAVEPDVLIIDEALSVGDARFSQKCMKRIGQFRETGTTLLFVSHDPHAVTTLCDECLLLVKGEVQERGTPSEVLESYGALLAAQGTENSGMSIRRKFISSGKSASLKPGAKKSGTFQAIISGVRLRNEKGTETEHFMINSEMTIEIDVLTLVELDQPTLGIQINDHLGTVVFGTNTSLLEIDLGKWSAQEMKTVSIQVPVQMGEGDYTITAAIHRDETHLEECFDWTDRAGVFHVHPAGKRLSSGRMALKTSWSVADGARDDQSQLTLDDIFSDIPDPQTMEHATPDPFLSGSWPPEESSSHQFRWFSRKATFLFRAKGNQIFLKGFLPPDLDQESITIRINGEAFTITFDHPENHFRLVIDLPENLSGKLLQIETDASNCWTEPSAHPDRPPRELAFALLEISSNPNTV